MALPATDNFNRADGDVGANWTALKNSVGNAVKLRVDTNQCRPDLSSNYQFNYWSADVFADDHDSQATLVDTVAYHGPAVRLSADGSGFVNGYIWLTNFGSDSRVFRMDGGSFTQIASGLSIPADGSVGKMSAVGSAIRVYQDGTQLGSDITDSTYPSGSAGLFGFSDGVSVRPHLDDWSGDNAVPAGGGKRFVLIPS